MAFRSQPAGLTADDLFYQQVMGTQFVYDETGAVVELWQLEHRLVVEAQQIQRENYLDGKPYPEPILSALFPTLAPSEDPCPELTALRRLFAEADEKKRLSKGARRRRKRREAAELGAAELEKAATAALASLKPSAPTAEQVDERRARRAAEAALEEEEKRAEKRAEAERAAEHQRLRDLKRARQAERK